MYVELHARSAFSFLAGASLPEELVSFCKDLGMPAVAPLDRHGVYGAARFHTAAKKAGIRAHIGAEVTGPDGVRYPLLVATRAGYRNLCRLITRMKLRAKKGEGAVTEEELAEHASGLICLTGGAEGPLGAGIRGAGLRVRDCRFSIDDCRLEKVQSSVFNRQSTISDRQSESRIPNPSSRAAHPEQPPQVHACRLGRQGIEGVRRVHQRARFLAGRHLRQQRKQQARAPRRIGSEDFGQRAARQASCARKQVDWSDTARDRLGPRPLAKRKRRRPAAAERRFELSAKRSGSHGPVHFRFLFAYGAASEGGLSRGFVCCLAVFEVRLRVLRAPLRSSHFSCLRGPVAGASCFFSW